MVYIIGVYTMYKRVCIRGGNRMLPSPLEQQLFGSALALPLGLFHR